MNYKHGQSGNKPLYRCWQSMRYRCEDTTHPAYVDYGGRGIRVCKAWASFAVFAADMGPHPGKGWTLERKRNNENYRRGNCVWATRSTQQRNKRTTKLTPEKVAQMKALYVVGNTGRPGTGYSGIAKQFGICDTVARRIIKEQLWR